MIPPCFNEASARFPKVNRQIDQILGELLHDNFKTSIQDLEKYINIQSSSANTSKVDFYEFMEKSVHSLTMNGMGKLPVEFLLKDNDYLPKMCSPVDQNPIGDNLEAVEEAVKEIGTDSLADDNRSYSS